MLLRQLFDAETSTYSYLLADSQTREAVLIDPVKEQLERDVALIEQLRLKLVHTLETHVHADHITSADDLRRRLGSRSVVAALGGAGCGDIHVRDGDRVSFGQHALVVRTTPGHTNGCLSFVLDDQSRVFTGDALLIRGCGRTDFQQGDCVALYRSVHDKLFTLPDDTLVFPGHDYRGHTCTTIGEEKTHNPRLGGGRSLEQFAEIMSHLDLAQPAKLDVAVAANLNCGLSDGADRRSPFVAGDVVEVDPAWVADNAAGVFVVDVRQPEEFHGELGRVAGGVLAPLGELAQRAQQWERGQPIVTVCRSGRRSLDAARTLVELGFREVASMREI
nr:MBL fold metallo-hydrolase [Deltaproteobacteria bacterium]